MALPPTAQARSLLGDPDGPNGESRGLVGVACLVEHGIGDHGCSQEGEAAGQPLYSGKQALFWPGHEREPEMAVRQIRLGLHTKHELCRRGTEIAETPGTTSITYWSDANVSDRRLIDVNPRVVAN